MKKLTWPSFWFLLCFFSLVTSAHAQVTATSLLNPSSNTANSVSGSGNGYSSNDSYITFNASGDYIRLGGFNISIPAGASVTGIEVRLEGNRTDDRDLSVSLSWNNGSTFTSAVLMDDFNDVDETRWVGHKFDNWGRTWTASEFSNANFIVQCIVPATATGDLFLDHVQVRVYYTNNLSTFTASGSFEVPAGVTVVGVDAWGAGAGGSNRGGASGGGGGGAYTAGQFTGQTAGTAISVTVGAGGAVATNGGFSRATSGATTITANGGSASSNSRNGGAGGAASTVSGAVSASFSGGDGGAARSNSSGGNNEAGGGGGGSAFPNQAGFSGTNGGSSASANTAGGAGYGSGGGGAAADGSPDAVAGNEAGGGGGGRGEGSSTSKSGANGRVILSYTCPTYSVTSVSATASVCTSAGDATITLTSSAAGLPVGTYTVTYNRSLPSATGLITTMTVTTAGSGSFTVSGFTTAGNATVTITNLASSVCSSAVSANNQSNTIVVAGPSVAGSIAGATAVCTGTNSTVLTLSGHTGSVQWQISTDNSSFTNISGATSASFTATNLTAARYYRCVVTNSPCSSATTASVAVTVSPAAVAGSISGAATHCSAVNTTTLTLSGHTGTVQWQQENNGGVYQNINAATGNTITLNNLSVSTNYRAVVTSGSCGSVTTNPITISIVEPSFAGSISGNQYVCAGSSTTLTVNESRGSIQWQSSTDDVTFTNISGATSTTLTLNNVQSLTYYRVVATNNNCTPAESLSFSVEPGAATTWNGTAWSNGEPNAGSPAIIAGNYSVNTDLTACTLTVTNNAIVSIPSGRNVHLNGAITVQSGSFTLQNNAYLYQATDVQNVGNITVRRQTESLRRLDYILWSAPIVGQSLQSFSPLTLVTPTSRFYNYNSSTNIFNSITTPSATLFEKGKAYLIRLPNNHPTTPSKWTGSFTGVPNNGEVNVTLANLGAGMRYNLVGNPYPSPISIDAFIAENSANITGALYFWRKTNGASNPSYCTYVNGTFISNNDALVNSMLINGNPFGANKVIAPGQGFFVEAKVAGTNVKFTNSMRVVDNGARLLRSADEQKNRFWLNATNASGAFAQIAVVYDEEAVTGELDAFDAEYFNDGTLSFASIDETSKLVVQGRSAFNADDIVPLHIKAGSPGVYTISLSQKEGLFEDGQQVVFLRDNLTGAVTNLYRQPYTFFSEAKEYNDRFELHYTNIVARENAEELVNAIAYAENNTLHISTGNQNIAKVEVYDLLGRKITEGKASTSYIAMSVPGAEQLLVLQITLENGKVISKKVGM